MSSSSQNPAAGGPTQVVISNEALQQLLEQVLAGKTSSNKPRTMKIPDADKFKGEPTQIRTWLRQCENKFSEYENPTDQQKLIYASNKMKGQAGSWMFSVLENNTYTTWEDFKKALKSAFGEADTKEAAKQRIKTLKQTGSVNDYWTKFQTNMNLLGWNEEALKDEFYDRLSAAIRGRLTNIIEKPTKLRTFAILCINLDNEINANKNCTTKWDFLPSKSNYHVPRPVQTSYTSRRPNGTFAPAPAQPHHPTLELPPGDSMDLDASRKKKYSPLTEADVTAWLDESAMS